MNKNFVLSVENTPDSTGTVIAETTRFDVYVSGEHDSHTDNEHTGFWGMIDLPEPLPPNFDRLIIDADEMEALKQISKPAYWYATGLIDAAAIMDDFEIDTECEWCLKRLQQ